MSAHAYTEMNNVIYPTRWGASPWIEYKKYLKVYDQLVKLGPTKSCETADELAQQIVKDGYALIDWRARDLIVGPGFFIEERDCWFTPVLVQSFNKKTAPWKRVQEIARGVDAHICRAEFALQICRQFIDLPRSARILVGMEPLPPFGGENYEDCYLEIQTDLVGGITLTATNGDAGFGQVFTHLLLCQE